jgi:N-acetylmuramoyl-L-alanine amidase
MTAASSIAQANAGWYDLYVALHSNAAPEGKYGEERGSLVFYYPSSRNGARAAQIFADNAKKIYPLPNLVRTVPTTELGEVSKTRAPAVLWEIAYHDNEPDARWITGNIDAIGRTVAASIAGYFGLPLAEPMTPEDGTVNTQWGGLNIRSYPSTGGGILATAPKGAALTVLGRLPGGWDVVRYGSLTGYASDAYIRV